MIQHGRPPYLECSTRGDVRFSAFGAFIIKRGFRRIEEIYQSAKRFPPGTPGITPEGHAKNWHVAKGKPAINQTEVAELYETLWIEYLQENPHLVETLIKASGLSDMFGQKGHVCQATTLWRIRNRFISTGSLM